MGKLLEIVNKFKLNIDDEYQNENHITIINIKDKSYLLRHFEKSNPRMDRNTKGYMIIGGDGYQPLGYVNGDIRTEYVIDIEVMENVKNKTMIYEKLLNIAKENNFMNIQIPRHKHDVVKQLVKNGCTQTHEDLYMIYLTI